MADRHRIRLNLALVVVCALIGSSLFVWRAVTLVRTAPWSEVDAPRAVLGAVLTIVGAMGAWFAIGWLRRPRA